MGRDAIVEFWRESSQASGTSEIRYVVDDRFDAGPAVVLDISVYVRASGTYWGVDRREIEIRSRLVTFLRVEGGRVTHHLDFVDYADGLRQIEAQR